MKLINHVQNNIIELIIYKKKMLIHESPNGHSSL